MLTIAKTKELLDSQNISDKEAQEIRDALYGLAEIALEFWQSNNQIIQKIGNDKKMCYNKNVNTAQIP